MWAFFRGKPGPPASPDEAGPAPAAEAEAAGPAATDNGETTHRGAGAGAGGEAEERPHPPTLTPPPEPSYRSAGEPSTSGSGELLPPGGQSMDLLLRLFNSEFFDEWMSLSYLHQYPQEGVHDYICNKLYAMPIERWERYLAQLCVVLVSQPEGALERFISDACARSVNVAVKVYWLLTAWMDDKPEADPTYKVLQRVRATCLDSALNGHWEPPFKEYLIRTYSFMKEAQSRQNSFTTGGSGSRPDLDLAELGADGGDLYDPEEEGGAAGGEGGGGGSKASRSSSSRASSPGAAKVPQLALAGLAAVPAAGVGAGERPEGTEREPGEVHHLPTGEALFSPLTSPKMRKNTFAATLDLIEALCEVSSRLVAAPEEDRQAELEAMLMEINDALDSPEAAGSACLYPLSEVHQQVLRIPPSEAILMNSRERCPYMVFIEVFEEEETPRPEGARVAGPRAAGASGGGLRFNSLFQAVTPPWHPPAPANGVNGDRHHPPGEGEEGAAKGTIAAAIESIMAGLRVDDKLRSRVVSPKRPQAAAAAEAKPAPEANGAGGAPPKNGVSKMLRNRMGRKHSRVPSTEALSAMAHRYRLPVPDMEDFNDRIAHGLENGAAVGEGDGAAASGPEAAAAEERRRRAREVYGEPFAARAARLRAASPYGNLPGWRLQSVIVKAGDDCRQELMALQLVQEFNSIFKASQLPLYVRDYGVIVTSSYSGLIETVVDSLSIHQLKKQSAAGASLRAHFEDKWGAGSGEFLLAQRNFVESMAAYSLLCYVLQIKDRHNSNLLLDSEGHLIHIDFGFMLSNSPGGINFETAPFKLTRELLEVMDSDAAGTPSELFDYFKVLVIQGFMACRKHSERIVKLIEIMHTSDFPCFKSGPRAIRNLEKRFHLAKTEEQCVQLVLDLIEESLDAWRTRQYDYYQRVTNGIL